VDAHAGGSSLATAIAEVSHALRTDQRAVLVAAPGTGKTTRVPLALLGAPWLGDQRIVMLEPRRVAARTAAEYLASRRGEPVGQVVGYRTRGDSRVSAATRVEVVTERLLTRRLQRDPELSGIGLVIFDEIHERSLDTDLGLALCLDVAAGLRPDLRILAMSATPDTEAVAAVLGSGSPDPGDGRRDGPAPVITCRAIAHEVVTTYVGRDRRRRLEDEVTDAVVRARHETMASGGDVLVFLPGRREIRFTAERLAAWGISSVPLTGGLDAAAVRVALRPDPAGHRKVILATSVAQTSLTIDGVRVVVDAGLERSARFDPARGLSGLVTVPVSVAAADQRRGRAGRQAPGRCYRLWSEAEHGHRRPHSEPEILRADLSPLALDLAAWGVADPAALRWITPPPASGWSVAAATLRALGAVDDTGRITADGRQIADLGAHPRLGLLMLRAARSGVPELGTLLAATIEAGARGDLRRALDHPERDVARVAAQWLRRVPTTTAGVTLPGTDDERVGALVATAFPERVARRRGRDRARYLTAGGVGVALPADSPLAGTDWLAVAELERVTGGDQRVVSAAPLGGAELDLVLREQLEQRAELTGGADGVLTARTTWNLGAIVVRSDPSSPPAFAEILDAAARLVAERGATVIHWTERARQLQARVAFARRFAPDLPDCGDDAIVEGSRGWLASHLTRGDTVRLGEISAGDVIAGLLSWEDRRLVDELAPTDVVVPSGRRHKITYGPEGPTMRVKLQEMFGAPSTPTVARGEVAVTLHLLSPAGRPLQVTRDLASFWAGSYRQVRAEMRGRYPKHPWPEDPAAATPTASVTPRRNRPDRGRP